MTMGNSNPMQKVNYLINSTISTGTIKIKLGVIARYQKISE